ncbi:MAG TPA: TauD/TfdA family dioxygenase [Solirubrobacteraceae bacterium]|jgi:gamma-butyrobetaine dioxygenase|nr:TauD/TfdA family dioxygenase [Solirubrobacteraceae bacterium]
MHDRDNEMRPARAHDEHAGTALAELAPLLAGVAFLPQRVRHDEMAQARELLDRDGAVILTGWPAEQDSAVLAAATILGTRLRWLEMVRSRCTEAGEELGLHTDGANVLIDVHDRPVRLRDPDVDYVLILCETPASEGGQSMIADGYRLVERLREDDPELYEFLTTVDVDFTSSLSHNGVGVMPVVARMVEWTRGGRMVVRAATHAQPQPREPRWSAHARHLAAYADVLATLIVDAPRERLAPGEILVLDNYRCPHGVSAHEGHRRTHVLRCKSAEAL